MNAVSTSAFERTFNYFRGQADRIWFYGATIGDVLTSGSPRARTVVRKAASGLSTVGDVVESEMRRAMRAIGKSA